MSVQARMPCPDFSSSWVAGTTWLSRSRSDERPGDDLGPPRRIRGSATSSCRHARGRPRGGRGCGQEGGPARRLVGPHRLRFAEVSQAAEQAAVRPLLRAGAGSPQPELSGNGFSYRHNWGPRRGQWTLGSTWVASPPARASSSRSAREPPGARTRGSSWGRLATAVQRRSAGRGRRYLDQHRVECGHPALCRLFDRQPVAHPRRH